MSLLAQERELDVRSGYEAELAVESTDITFHDTDGGSVTIRVKIRNEGERRSGLTVMRLESAPLGAFVPWQPLAELIVPPIQPGGSRELSVDVERPHPAPLGDFDRVPPARLLTAVSSPDEPLPPKAGIGARLDGLRARETRRVAAASFALKRASLAPDLMEMVGRGQPHWAGNINVFVGSRAVERHMAKALRVYPGRPNLAMFIVGGGGKRDAYAFDVVGLTPDWKSALHDVTNARSPLAGPSEARIQKTRWVEASGRLMIMLVTNPPAGCTEGNLEVRVTRQSCQKTAVVEFNLDPSAQGTGCYSL